MAAFRTSPAGRMITKEEARAAVETELFALKLTKPMTSAEKETFCQFANSTLDYHSNADRMREIRAWT